MKRVIRHGLMAGGLLAAAACGENGLGTTEQAAVVSTDLVISQVYGGGGNANAIYTNDFVELVNIGTATLQMSNYSVQYASATGNFSSTTTTMYVDLPTFSLAPGQYFLVQLAAGTNTIAPLPTPDATGTIAMSSTAGKVAVTLKTSKLDACGDGTTPCSAANWVDLVGYGNGATQYEGAGAAPGTSNSTGDLRKACTDTGNNNADFTNVTPVAHNSASTFLSCAVDGGAVDAGDGGVIVVDGGSVDGGVVDGGTTDGGAADSGAADSGAADSGAADSGAADSGAADSGAADGGAGDASASDGGGKDGGFTIDSGTPDSGAKDSGAKDSGTADAGGGTGGGGGCSCDVRGAGRAPPWAGLGWALGLVALVRSRRRERRPG